MLRKCKKTYISLLSWLASHLIARGYQLEDHAILLEYELKIEEHLNHGSRFWDRNCPACNPSALDEHARYAEGAEDRNT